MKRVAWLFSAPASHQVARGLTLCALFDLQRLPSRSRKSRRVASRLPRPRTGERRLGPGPAPPWRPGSASAPRARLRSGFSGMGGLLLCRFRCRTAWPPLTGARGRAVTEAPGEGVGCGPPLMLSLTGPRNTPVPWRGIRCGGTGRAPGSWPAFGSWRLTSVWAASVSGAALVLGGGGGDPPLSPLFLLLR